MAVTIVEEARPGTCRSAITGGVDTHADIHVAAALDPVGGLLGVREFPATAAGYAGPRGWLGGFGTVGLVGIEGTGSYGAGLARHVAAAGIRVVEVDRSDRQDRPQAAVRGREKVPVYGQVVVLAGGRLKVPIPRSSCRPGLYGLGGDGGGVSSHHHRPGSFY